MSLLLMVMAGANVDAASKSGVTPLYIAAWEGHEACMSLLLKAGAKPKAVSWYRLDGWLVMTFLTVVLPDGALCHRPVTTHCLRQSHVAIHLASPSSSSLMTRCWMHLLCALLRAIATTTLQLPSRSGPLAPRALHCLT